MYKITSFINRLKKIGVRVDLCSNYPWVYIYKINGKRVTETFMGDYGFTIMILPIKKEQKEEFTDIGEIFKLIRKYTKKQKRDVKMLCSRKT